MHQGGRKNVIGPLFRAGGDALRRVFYKTRILVLFVGKMVHSGEFQGDDDDGGETGTVLCGKLRGTKAGA